MTTIACTATVTFIFRQVATNLSNMTHNDLSEPKRSVYDTCDPQYLRALREAADMDLVVLARTACLSVAQVRQLETDDSEGLFYSDAIKRQAYKRLLMILGAEPPTVEVPQELRDAHKVAEAHLTTLDQIVAMSHQPTLKRSTSDAWHAGVAKFKEHKQVLSAFVFLLVAVILLAINGSQGTKQAAASAASMVAKLPEVVAPVVSMPASEPAASDVASAPVAIAPVAIAPVASAAPAPVVVVPSVAAASASVAVPVLATHKTSACVYSSDAMPQLSPFVAQKEGRYVYVVSAANVELCVIDGNKQATVLQMKAGENRSVYGVSPWQVSSADLSKIQIYFQGGRVSLPDAATRVKLVETAVSR